jgi:hypothetical protein
MFKFWLFIGFQIIFDKFVNFDEIQAILFLIHL